MTRSKIPQILILALVLFVLTSPINAEVPQMINYQGRLTDSGGDPVINGDYEITFKIWNWESGGTQLWSSGPQIVSVTEGLFSYKLGSAVSLQQNLFTDTTRWLEITVETDPPIAPRTKFITVPYAYHSLRSDTAAYAMSGAGGGDGDITAVYASTGLDGGGETGDVMLSIADGGVSGLQIASAAISAGKIQENAVWSDHILDGTITASDIDNTSVQQRVTGTVGPGEYIIAITADGSVVAGVDQTGTSKAMCADMYEGMTNSSSQVTITFPVTFTAAPYFSVTGLFKSAAHVGKMAHVVVSSLTTTEVTLTIQYWNGAIFTGVGDSVEILLSYTAMEK